MKTKAEVLEMALTAAMRGDSDTTASLLSVYHSMQGAGVLGVHPVSMEYRIDNWFSYHPPTPEKTTSYCDLREAAKTFAKAIDLYCPDGADKSAAIRKVREAVMTANAAIACEGE